MILPFRLVLGRSELSRHHTTREFGCSWLKVISPSLQRAFSVRREIYRDGVTLKSGVIPILIERITYFAFLTLARRKSCDTIGAQDLYGSRSHRAVAGDWPRRERQPGRPGQPSADCL